MILVAHLHSAFAAAQIRERAEPSAASEVPGGETSAVSGRAEESLALTYDAPPSCPERASFVEQVRALTRAATFDAASDDPSVRKLRIEVVPHADAFRGRLHLTEGETRATREFDASTCPEVVEALALATALALDPDALSGEEEPEPEPPPDHPVDSEPDSTPDEDEPVETPADDSGARHRWTMVLGVRGHLGAYRARARVSPTDPTLQRQAFVRAGPVVFLEIEGSPLGVLSSLDLAVGSSFARVAPVTFRHEPLAEVGLCPAWWEPATWFRVAPCARLSVGYLFANNTSQDYGGSFRARRVAAPATFFSGRSQFDFGTFRVSVEVGADVPWAENSFELVAGERDETLVTLTDRVAPRASVALGWELF